MIRISRKLGWAAICLALQQAQAAQLRPVGPELAPTQIGYLLKAAPLELQTNPLAVGGTGVTMWACEYRVGHSDITLAPTTQPGDPMPCKREVRFSR